MRIKVAVVGSTSAGKTSLINHMSKYPLFEFEEYSFKDANLRNHDYYLFVVDAGSDMNNQLEFVNTAITNSLIVVLKTDVTPFEKNDQLLNKRTFYFSQYDFYAGKTVFDLLRFIVERRLSVMVQELESIKKLLDDTGYYNLCPKDRNKIFFAYHWFLESENKNLINKCVNQMGEINSEELAAIFPFQEIYNAQTEMNKTILRKIISRKFKPSCIPSFNKYLEY
ncbi:MAG: hypothetical protein IJ312_03135 [Treponema sp.]|nr:hypothetical protein [Treponema sp.]